MSQAYQMSDAERTLLSFIQAYNGDDVDEVGAAAGLTLSELHVDDEPVESYSFRPITPADAEKIIVEADDVSARYGVDNPSYEPPANADPKYSLLRENPLGHLAVRPGEDGRGVEGEVNQFFLWHLGGIPEKGEDLFEEAVSPIASRDERFQVDVGGYTLARFSYEPDVSVDRWEEGVRSDALEIDDVGADIVYASADMWADRMMEGKERKVEAVKSLLEDVDELDGTDLETAINTLKTAQDRLQRADIIQDRTP